LFVGGFEIIDVEMLATISFRIERHIQEVIADHPINIHNCRQK
jgi:hypothetical protein